MFPLTWWDGHVGIHNNSLYRTSLNRVKFPKDFFAFDLYTNMAVVTSCENTSFSINGLLRLCLYLQKNLNAGLLLDTRTCRKVAIAKIWPYGTCSASLRIFHSVWSWERIWSEALVTKICSKFKSNLVPTGLFSVGWHQDSGQFQSRKWQESVLLLTKSKPDSGDEIEALRDGIGFEVNSF